MRGCLKINVYNRQKILPISKSSVRDVVREMVTYLSMSCEEISIYFVSEKRICELHKQFFDDPTPTDCITFPVDNNPTCPPFFPQVGSDGRRDARRRLWRSPDAVDAGRSIGEAGQRSVLPSSAPRWGEGWGTSWVNTYLGDLFICPAIARQVAPQEPYRELLLYLVHALLHLKGHDDLDPKKRRLMRKMEKKCMGHLNVLNVKISPA